MKKTLLTFQIITLFILIIPLQAKAQCPWNRVNCSHGCGRHIDENGDGFCDHSIIDKSLLQPKEEEKEVLKEIQQQEKIKKEEPTEISINKSQKNQKDKHNGRGLNQRNKNKKESETIDNQKIQDTITEEKIIIPIQKPSQKAKPYDLILISFITFVLYSITFILSKLNLLRKIYHRRIWNFILLLTFLLSCLLGFFLVIQINYDFVMEWFRTVLYWHVQIGISMTIISIFHIFWHLKYFQNIFKKPKGC